MQAGPIRTRLVRPARAAMSVIDSIRGLPSRLSPTQRSSKRPEPSAISPISNIWSGVIAPNKTPRFGSVRPNLMPHFTSYRRTTTPLGVSISTATTPLDGARSTAALGPAPSADRSASAAAAGSGSPRRTERMPCAPEG